ncbi:MAG: zf-HC2 domain-containing protein [Candidatus Omnitrophica bacterium]|nr:zf-HC2 domain-containing protein [Candidatus Omnitrophota bacterium]MCM8776759.1 zf-HC2 domain-containing protein [Candidatus Omnitrophota bacterium]
MDRYFSCKDIYRMLSGYIDDEIDTMVREIMEEHIKECERCLSLLHTLEKTIVFSRETHRRKKVPERFVKKVYYEIRIRYKR